MSAANWTRCPKCGGDFREDWEIGLNTDGDFAVEYSGACRACRFTHKFSHFDYILGGRS